MQAAGRPLSANYGTLSKDSNWHAYQMCMQQIEFESFTQMLRRALSKSTVSSPESRRLAFKLPRAHCSHVSFELLALTVPWS